MTPSEKQHHDDLNIGIGIRKRIQHEKRQLSVFMQASGSSVDEIKNKIKGYQDKLKEVEAKVEKWQNKTSSSARAAFEEKRKFKLKGLSRRIRSITSKFVLLKGFQFDSWHNSIVRAIELFDENDIRWKPHAPAIPVIKNHGMKTPCLADLDKLSLVFQNYKSEQERAAKSTFGTLLPKNKRKSDSFTRQIKNLPRIDITEAVDFSQKIAQTQVASDFSMCISRCFQNFLPEFPKKFPGFSQKFPRNFQEIHVFLVDFDIGARHEAKMAKNAKKGMKYVGVMDGKVRKEYSISESDRFDDFTGVQQESEWYKIDRETEPWAIWDGYKEMQYLQWLKNDMQQKKVNKIKQKIRAKFEGKKIKKKSDEMEIEQ